MALLVARTASSQGGGDIVHGEAFTVSGSGFGTREDYGGATAYLQAELVDWNSSVTDVMDGLSADWSWNASMGTHWNLIDDDPRTANSGNFAQRWNPDGENSNDDFMYWERATPSTSNRIFGSMWMRVGSISNGKHWRYKLGTAEYDLWVNIKVPYVWSDSGSPQLDDGDGLWSPDQFNDDEWHLWWWRMVGKSGDTNLLEIGVIGANSNTPFLSAEFGALDVPPTGQETEFWLGAGQDVGTIGAGQYSDFDDLYMDFSDARVALADSATWANVTVLEYQPITSWSDTSIECVAKVGGLTGTVHVYVWDASNNRQYIGTRTVS